MTNVHSKPRFKRIISGVAAGIMALSMVPGVMAYGEQSTSYPYTVYADSAKNSIAIKASTITINGDLFTNGKYIQSAQYVNHNGKVIENIKENEASEDFDFTQDLILINNKVWKKWFSKSCGIFDKDISISTKNFKVNNPKFVNGKCKLNANITMNRSIGADSDIKIAGETLNSTKENCIYSKNGNINIWSKHVNLNGFIYAPNGTVTISSDDINITGVIIAKKVVLKCNSNLNLNYSSSVGEFIGTTTEELSQN